MTDLQNLSRRSLIGGLAAAGAGAAALASTARAQQTAPTGDLAGKTAFITGGARGIGLATAQEMAKAGANIVLFDIATPNLPPVAYALSSPAELAAAQERIEALGASCMTYRGDVRNLADQQAAMRQAVERFGNLDIVVANAGVGHAGPIESVTADEISMFYETNVGGYMQTTQAAVPHLRNAGGGRIICIS
jgi:NAD(P)-dependent dehydrogenase (short-subunit alcohol dehydrogenase family)